MGGSARGEDGITALVTALGREGFRGVAGAGVDAALAHYQRAGEADLSTHQSLGASGIGRHQRTGRR